MRAWRPLITIFDSRLRICQARTLTTAHLRCVLLYVLPHRFSNKREATRSLLFERGWLFAQLYNFLIISFQVQWIRVSSPGSIQDLSERVFSLRDPLLCSAGKMHWARVFVMQVRHAAGDSFNPGLEHFPWKSRRRLDPLPVNIS